MAKQPAGIHVEDIKAALRRQHGPITHLSVAWGYHRCAISSALRDPHYSDAIERRIAAALGIKPHRIWPDRWTSGGTPLPRSDRPQIGRTIPTETSQKRRAA